MGTELDPTAIDDRRQLDEALFAFKSAALQLSAKLELGDNADKLDGYPDYLPSFDEFAHEVAAMTVLGYHDRETVNDAGMWAAVCRTHGVSVGDSYASANAALAALVDRERR